MSFKARDFIRTSQLNWRFHEVIYLVCPNRPAVDMVMAIKNQLKRYNIKTMLVQGRGEDSLEEHAKILSALERGNEDDADLQMRRHIVNLRSVLRKHFELLV